MGLKGLASSGATGLSDLRPPLQTLCMVPAIHLFRNGFPILLSMTRHGLFFKSENRRGGSVQLGGVLRGAGKDVNICCRKEGGIKGRK